jgi:hypothetical protein
MDPNATYGQSRVGGFRWGGAGVADQAPHVTPGQSQRNHGPQALLALAVDALRLVDLQMQLLAVDVRSFWSKARITVLLLAVGTAGLIAALPVGLFGCAEYLRQSLSISIEFALLLVAGACLLVAGGLIVWSIHQLTLAAVPLQRSAEELRENVRWMRGLLHNEPSAPANAPPRDVSQHCPP